jgi:hypothetical protein
MRGLTGNFCFEGPNNKGRTCPRVSEPCTWRDALIPAPDRLPTTVSRSTLLPSMRLPASCPLAWFPIGHVF